MVGQREASRDDDDSGIAVSVPLRRMGNFDNRVRVGEREARHSCHSRPRVARVALNSAEVSFVE